MGDNLDKGRAIYAGKRSPRHRPVLDHEVSATIIPGSVSRTQLHQCRDVPINGSPVHTPDAMGGQDRARGQEIVWVIEVVNMRFCIHQLRPICVA